MIMADLLLSRSSWQHLVAGQGLIPFSSVALAAEQRQRQRLRQGRLSYVVISLLFVVPMLGDVCLGQNSSRAAYFVSCTGNDGWSGRLPEPNREGSDGPFATLERARAEIRRIKRSSGVPRGGITVELRAGVYERSGTFELGAEDSGTAEAPVIYRARAGEQVRLVGGKQVREFRPVTESAILKQLDPKARGHVLWVDLRAQGIADLGQVTENRLQLYFQDKPMTLARWPNKGFANIVDVVGGKPHKIFSFAGDRIGKFTYEGDRPVRWKEDKDIWLHGYWFWDWSDLRQNVASIDT